MKTFVIVARTRAAAVFKADDCYSLNYRIDSGPTARMLFRTRYVDKKLSHPIPEDLWVEIRCSGESIEQAIEGYGNPANEINGVIGLCTNAYMGNLEPDMVFEVTDGVDERDFFKSFLPEQPISVVPGRTIDVNAVRSFSEALVAHPDRDRLMRAIAQYQMALRHWTLGSEVLSVASLFMAAESLKVAALRKHLNDLGVEKRVLAEEWGYEEARRLTVNSFLEEQARTRLIFHGDAACHRDAKWVSDQFEHGTTNFGLLRPRACAVMNQATAHVRNSIIETSNLELAAARTIQSEQYTRPRGPLKVAKYLRGKLKGELRNFAAPDQAYPTLHWVSKLSKVEVDSTGKYSFATEETFTPRLGKEVTFAPTRYEAWDGSVLADVPLPISGATSTQHAADQQADRE